MFNLIGCFGVMFG